MGHSKGETEEFEKAASGDMGSPVACASHPSPHWLAVSSFLSRATAIFGIKGAKRRSGDFARMVVELTPGDLPRVASAVRLPKGDLTAEQWIGQAGKRVEGPNDKERLVGYESVTRSLSIS